MTQTSLVLPHTPHPPALGEGGISTVNITQPNPILTCGSFTEDILSIIDRRTPVAASKKSSSRETNTLARMKGGTEDARRQRKNELLQTMFKLPLLL